MAAKGLLLWKFLLGFFFSHHITSASRPELSISMEVFKEEVALMKCRNLHFRNEEKKAMRLCVLMDAGVRYPELRGGRSPPRCLSQRLAAL